MCGRYTLTTPGGRALAERFAVAEPDTLEPATLERFNVCPTEPIATVTGQPERIAQTVRWGLVPPWARELGKGFQPINARAENAATKAPFAELMARPERRCLVLADGWYEWLKAERRAASACRSATRSTAARRSRSRASGGGAGSAPSSCSRPASSRARPTRSARRSTTGCRVVLAGPDEEAAWLAGESDGLLGAARSRAHDRRARQPGGQQGRRRGRRSCSWCRPPQSPHSSASTPDLPASGRVWPS